MNRPRIQVAVSDPTLRQKMAAALLAAGYDVHFEPEAQDTDLSLLEARTLADLRQTWMNAIHDSRSIATAVGMLMERHRLPAQRAFDALRRQARSERTQLAALARQIVSGAAQLKLDPPA